MSPSRRRGGLGQGHRLQPGQVHRPGAAALEARTSTLETRTLPIRSPLALAITLSEGTALPICRALAILTKRPPLATLVTIAALALRTCRTSTDDTSHTRTCRGIT